MSEMICTKCYQRQGDCRCGPGFANIPIHTEGSLPGPSDKRSPAFRCSDETLPGASHPPFNGDAEAYKPLYNQPVEATVRCEDCGKPYPFGLDTVLSPLEWERVTGFRDGSGILCANCIVERASHIDGAIVTHLHVEYADPRGNLDKQHDSREDQASNKPFDIESIVKNAMWDEYIWEVPKPAVMACRTVVGAIKERLHKNANDCRAIANALEADDLQDVRVRLNAMASFAESKAKELEWK